MKSRAGRAAASAAAGLFCLGAACGVSRAEESKRVRVAMDCRLELLGAVQALSGEASAPAGFVLPQADPMSQVPRRFSSFRGHAAVGLTAGLEPRSFDFMRRGDVLGRLSPLPEMTTRYFIPDLFIQEAGGPEALGRWLQSLRDFSRQARFEEFFEEEKAGLEYAVAPLRAAIEGGDLIGKIERYTGLAFQGRYTISPSPYYKGGNMLNSVIPQPDGSIDILSIVGPRSDAGKLDFQPERLLPSIWHELSHGVLDTASDIYKEEIALSEGAYRRLPWDCYGNWQQCVKEHVVRAVMIRMIAGERGQAAADEELRREGEKKYPYLKAFTRRLREYESQRGRFPTLVAFFPRLLAELPRGPAPAVAAPAAPAAGPDPGPQWTLQATAPFATDGERERAISYIDRVLSQGADPRLLLKRACLAYLLGRYPRALEDAGGVLLVEGGSVGARLVRAMALQAQGREEEARQDLEAAGEACRLGAGPAAACRNAADQLRGRGGRPSASSPAALFEVDPRVELLSAILMLSDPQGFQRQFQGRPPPYAVEAGAYFAAYSSHPVVARMRRLLEGGMPDDGPVQLFLRLTPPPGLAARSSQPAAFLGGAAQAAEFLGEARDFARRSRFSEFFESHQADYREFVERARRESAATLSLESLEAYLKRPFSGRYRFLLAALLPGRWDANVVLHDDSPPQELRVRSALYGAADLGGRSPWDAAPGDGRARFNFDGFASGLAHELTHTMADPLALPHRDELLTYAGLSVKGCADSWLGCVVEHVDLAVTLRALARERGEGPFHEALAEYERRGFPYLGALCERLKEFEDPANAASFEEFYPRLVAVFREALLSKVKSQAREASRPQAAGEDGGRPAPAGATAGSAFEVDPRFELFSVVVSLAPRNRARRGAAAPRGYRAEVDRYFAGSASHPAVATLAGLMERAETAEIPARLVFALSPPPDLALRAPLQDVLPDRSGGGEDWEAFLEQLRDFYRTSRFQDFFDAHQKDYAGFVAQAARESEADLDPRAAAAYLGLRPAAQRRRFVLAAALPDGYGRSTVVDALSGLERQVRPGDDSAGGAPRFSFDSYAGSEAYQLIYDAVKSLEPREDAARQPSAAFDLSKACRGPRSPGWPACVREHLVYAVSQRVAAPGAEGKWAGAGSGIVKALPYLKAVLRKLQEYEAQRARYPTLKDFYPELKAVFAASPAAAAPAGARVQEARKLKALYEAAGFPEAESSGEDAAADAAANVAFVVDPRVELVSVAALLSGAAEKAPPSGYRAEAEAYFSRFSSHPFVAGVSRLLERRREANAPLRLLYDVSREAAPAPGAAAFLESARDFMNQSGFREFFEEQRPRYRGFIAQAQTEAALAMRPRAAAAYLGRPFLGRYRFPLAALLAQSRAINVPAGAPQEAEVRVRAGVSFQETTRFSFDAFGSSPAHELVHTQVNPLVRVEGHGRPPAGCNDRSGGSWAGCVEEHVVYAVTLRVLAQEAGAKVYEQTLGQYEARGFPYLRALCERLAEYEADRRRYPALDGFFGRLEEVFQRRSGAEADPEVQRLKERGLKAFLAGRGQEALESFTAALKISEADVEAILDLAVVHDHLGSKAAALEGYGRAVSLGSLDLDRQREFVVGALSSRASLHESAGRRRQAAEDLRKALELAAEDWSGRAALNRRLRALAP